MQYSRKGKSVFIVGEIPETCNDFNLVTSDKPYLFVKPSTLKISRRFIIRQNNIYRKIINTKIINIILYNSILILYTKNKIVRTQTFKHNKVGKIKKCFHHLPFKQIFRL